MVQRPHAYGPLPAASNLGAIYTQANRAITSFHPFSLRWEEVIVLNPFFSSDEASGYDETNSVKVRKSPARFLASKFDQQV